MSEIDVSKCESYCNGICEEYIGYWGHPDCEDRPNCHYRQLQQANKTIESQKGIIKKFVDSEQQLKAENEFKESQINDWIKQYKLAHQKYMKLQTENEKYKQCLDEIEEIIKELINCGYLDLSDCIDELNAILQLIKQAKEGGE